jgi:hypothetical protein
VHSESAAGTATGCVACTGTPARLFGLAEQEKCFKAMGEQK